MIWVLWESINQAINTSLVKDGDSAQLSYFLIGYFPDNLTQSLRLRTIANTGDSPLGTGPDLTSAVENYARAITIRAGSSFEYTFVGPNHSQSSTDDSAEPYNWQDENYTATDYQTIINQYNALSAADKAATILIIDDGVVPATAPGTPAEPTTTISSGSSITPAWVLPDDGGNDITGQRLQYRRSGQTPEDAWTNVDLGATVTSHEVTGLMVGVEYEFRVRATNSVGDGDYSPPATATILRPAQPAAPTITHDNSRTLTASWIIPDGNGLPITGQTLQYREDWDYNVDRRQPRRSRHVSPSERSYAGNFL